MPSQGMPTIKNSRPSRFRKRTVDLISGSPEKSDVSLYRPRITPQLSRCASVLATTADDYETAEISHSLFSYAID